MRDATVLIVTYNSAAEIGRCLDAALRWCDDIIVVDNASTDGTVAAVSARPVRLIANPTNAGFAAAVNQGVRATEKPYILLLNPDAQLQSPMDPMALCLTDPTIAAAGGRLTGLDGRTQRGFLFRRFPSARVLAYEVLGINRLFPQNSVNWHYRCYGIDTDQSGEVDQPAGALLMFRRDVWEKLGGFDERFYPAWFEDVDFCKRLKDLGYRIRYVPSVSATHAGGHSVRNLPEASRVWYWYGNLLKYAAKHHSPNAFRGVCLALLVGSVLRMGAEIGIQRSFQPLVVYGRIIGLSFRGLLGGAHAEVFSAGRTGSRSFNS